ncbi:MAG TPA: hypothetical protein VIJ38_06775 [Acidobacteriaceae bacterium]
MEFNRRKLCAMAGAAIVVGQGRIARASNSKAYEMVAQTDHKRILLAGEKYLSMEPVTITAFRSARSPGGLHDYFSQADY